MPAEQGAPASGVKPVVTIFEAFGAGATTIGRKVAEQLGLPFHAQAFSSELIAGESPEEVIADQAVPEDRVHAANLDHLDPDLVDPGQWARDPDTLVVPRAGEDLFRLRRDRR
ncbi:MAG TPA: hypothetical protein VK875_08880 [Euzebyales bacterium]|nr:hypothetical protein [Euzebyales bacterium]